MAIDMRLQVRRDCEEESRSAQTRVDAGIVKRGIGDKRILGAGDGIRTRHVQLGKLAFYP
jgi:hypothetical protein